jgi:hypothetical protein
LGETNLEGKRRKLCYARKKEKEGKKWKVEWKINAEKNIKTMLIKSKTERIVGWELILIYRGGGGCGV